MPGGGVHALDRRVDANEQLTGAESHAWSKWASHLFEQIAAAGKRRKKKRRKKRKLPKASSPRSALVRQRVPVHASAFVAALVATPFSVFVIADSWNDYTGGVTMDFVPSSPVKQYVPRSSMWRQFGCDRG